MNIYIFFSENYT